MSHIWLKKMLKIKRLYSEPEEFDPITFSGGINLILGETTDSTDKTNGVGKSLAIEFLNYGLLKKHHDSRISLIPPESFSPDTFICLDFNLGSHSITTKRCVALNNCPTLIVDGREQKFENLDDALRYLSTLLIGTSTDESLPSFRSMLGPIIRDETSEFKSIVQCYDTNRRIPPDYTPHLYLLSINSEPYKDAKKLWLEIDKTTKAISKIKESIVTITGKNVSEAKADLNELSNQVQRIQGDIERLENIEGYEIIKQDILEIEQELDKERSKQAVLNTELSKIKLFQGDKYINENEVAELYNQFKEGLGEIIKKEIQDVVAFKKKIDNFQRNLIDGRRKSIDEQLKQTNSIISKLDKKYKEKLSVIDQDGFLKNLKQTFATYQKKSEEYSSLSSFTKKHSEFEQQKKETKRERNSAIYLLDTYVSEAQEDTLDSFEKTILDIHDYIAGNRMSSFEINISKKKEIVKFELRIYDDGSHSNEREKVFIYDLALLLNKKIASVHPGLLVHDNIFDVDQDTLIKSLNYLNTNISLLANKQYILTINSDKFKTEDKKLLKLDLEKFKKAAFTKNNRFLKTRYQELSK